MYTKKKLADFKEYFPEFSIIMYLYKLRVGYGVQAQIHLHNIINTGTKTADSTLRNHFS